MSGGKKRKGLGSEDELVDLWMEEEEGKGGKGERNGSSNKKERITSNLEKDERKL